jgi:uncharacterized membrane protein
VVEQRHQTAFLHPHDISAGAPRHRPGDAGPPRSGRVLRLVSFWDVWALVYLGLTWLLIMRSSAQQTRQWALDQRIPPHPDLSILRSVILRVLRTLFLISRTSSLFFTVFVSLVSMALAIRLVPDVRDMDTTGGLTVAVMSALGVISAWGVLHTSFTLHYASPL